jgi:ABC-2 type transport system ATP-binding protein
MVCEDILILNQGNLAYADSTKNLAKGSSNEVFLTVKGSSKRAASLLNKIDSVTAVKSIAAEPLMVGEPEGSICRFKIRGKNAHLREDIFHALAEANMPILELAHAQRSLEQVFLGITAGVDV